MPALLDRRRRPLPAVEAAHPLPVAPQDVHQRPVQRSPEGAAVAAALFIREPRGGSVEAPVHLAIVGGHGADVGRGYHRLLQISLVSLSFPRKREPMNSSISR